MSQRTINTYTPCLFEVESPVVQVGQEITVADLELLTLLVPNPQSCNYSPVSHPFKLRGAGNGIRGTPQATDPLSHIPAHELQSSRLCGVKPHEPRVCK